MAATLADVRATTLPRMSTRTPTATTFVTNNEQAVESVKQMDTDG